MSAIGRRLCENEHLLARCGANFFVMAGQCVVSSVVPLFVEDFAVSTTMVGLTLTVFALACLILNVPAGLIADRLGRRYLLVRGPIITSIGMFGSGMAGDIWTLLAWRFAAGAESAFFMSGALVHLIHVARTEQRARRRSSSPGSGSSRSAVPGAPNGRASTKHAERSPPTSTATTTDPTPGSAT